MELIGVGAAPGVAVGPAWRHAGGTSGGQPVLDVRVAAQVASQELMALAARVRASGRGDEAAIFEAQAMMVHSPLVEVTFEGFELAERAADEAAGTVLAARA